MPKLSLSWLATNSRCGDNHTSIFRYAAAEDLSLTMPISRKRWGPIFSKQIDLFGAKILLSRHKMTMYGGTTLQCRICLGPLIHSAIGDIRKRKGVRSLFQVSEIVTSLSTFHDRRSFPRIIVHTGDDIRTANKTPTPIISYFSLPPNLNCTTMRFSTISLLLQVLALGYTSALEAEKGPHNLVCGVNSEAHHRRGEQD